MGRRSKILTLPPEVKAWFDQVLVARSFSDYEAIAAELNERAREAGYEITVSRSAAQRYGSKFEERMAALKLASEQARAVVTATPNNEGAVSEALMRLVQERMFQHLVEHQIDPGKPIAIEKLARAIAEVGRMGISHRKWLDEIRSRARAAADAAAKIAKRGGLSAEAVAEIRAHILGIEGK